MDFELSQISEGPANEACSLFDCLKYMPSGEWRHLPRTPEGRHQLEVFLHRSRDGAVEQKVVDFIRWLEDNLDISRYMWIVNLVQVWMPISSGDGDETILSVSGQPFGVGRLSNGIFRYRYDSILSHDRKTFPSCSGDLISTAFTTGLARFEHHHYHPYGVQSRWALPLVDPTTGMPIGVLEFVTMNQYRCEYHGMLTQCFLDVGPKYYEQFCKDTKGKSVEYLDQQYYSHEYHLPTQEDTTFGKVNLYDVSNGLLENANEDHTNSANAFGMQQNTGRTVNFEIGESSGEDTWSWQTIYNGLLGNANEDDTNYANGLGMQQNTGRTMNFEIGESSGKDNFFNGIDQYLLSSDVQVRVLSSGTDQDEQVRVPIVLDIGGNNDQMDDIFQSLDDNPAIRDDGAEGERVRAQENIGGVTNGIIEDTTQRRSPPAISRKPRKPLYCDQLKQNFGRPLQEVADEYGVHLSTAKRRCRECHIKEWPSSRKRNKATQKNMIVKATYGNITVKVWDFDSTKEFEWLTKELGLKLKLQVGSFRIQYREDTGDLILISCTEHLMRRLNALYSSSMKNMYLIVSLHPTS